MIYLTWKNNGTVVNGWTNDTCTTSVANTIDYVDNVVDFGSLYAGARSSTIQLMVSTRKFISTETVTSPVTNCALYIGAYYAAGSTQSISIPDYPTDYRSSWSFCNTGGTSKSFSGGYTGTSTPAYDITLLQNTFPQQTPPAGLFVSVDKGCNFTLFDSDTGVEADENTYVAIGNANGGSTTAGQIDPGNECELQFYISYPTRSQMQAISGSSDNYYHRNIQFLIGMSYDVTE